MKAKEKALLKNLTAVELAAKARQLTADLVKARAELAAGRSKNTSLVANLRKQLAIVKTYLNIKMHKPK